MSQKSAQVPLQQTNKNYSPPSKFTAAPTCYNTKEPHLSEIKITFTYKNLPVCTAVGTAQACY